MYDRIRIRYLSEKNFIQQLYFNSLAPTSVKQMVGETKGKILDKACFAPPSTEIG